MPLTRRQFELGIDADIENSMRQIFEFLIGNRDLAYTEEELSETLKLRGHIFQRALEVLVELGAIESRAVVSHWYFGFAHEIDEETWEQKPKIEV